MLGFDSRGERVYESEPLGFPDWVSVRGKAAERSDNAFEVDSSMKDGLLVLRWSARLRHAYGISVGPDQTGDRSAAGTAEIDVETGMVERKEGAPPLSATPPVALPPGFRKRPSDEMYCQLGRGGASYGGEPVPFRTGSDTLALLALAYDGRNPLMPSGPYRLRLERWNMAGQALDPVELHEAAEAPALSVDLDRSHLLIHGETRTKVVSLETGALLGKLPSSLFAGEAGLEHGFAVQGKRLIYVAEQREPTGASGQTPVRRFLRAVDMKSGKRAWERSILGFIEYPPVPRAIGGRAGGCLCGLHGSVLLAGARRFALPEGALLRTPDLGGVVQKCEARQATDQPPIGIPRNSNVTLRPPW